MSAPPAADAISIDALIERYAREGLAELAVSEAADAASQDRLRAHRPAYCQAGFLHSPGGVF